ncbi:PAS domain-containing protein, partial [Leclercia adecarboxylata]|nr:PAS domain-containing protein [Leclercia adecarboxylata]
MTDTAGIVTDWNAGAVQVMGWTAEEMRGQSASRFFTPTDQARDWLGEEMQIALREGHALSEHWHLRKDGQQFWASSELSPIHGDDGSHLGFMKILRDRTKEHLAGLAIEDTQVRYRLATKASNDAVWDWDLATNHVLWNGALEHAYG